MWHDSCVVWHAITWGVRKSLTGQWVVKKTPCPWSQRGKELDHRTPVMLAARQGTREYVRAFLPENLQWLCEECHRLKINEDAAYTALDSVVNGVLAAARVCPEHAGIIPGATGQRR